jgi:GTP-binding protein Era
MLGILTTATEQILFLDTPGIHRPLHKLGEYMVSVAANTVEDADIVLWLVDINDAPTDEDRAIAELLYALTTRRHNRIKLPPLVIGLNQCDRWPSDAEATAARSQEYLALLDWLTPGAGHGGGQRCHRRWHRRATGAAARAAARRPALLS